MKVRDRRPEWAVTLGLDLGGRSLDERTVWVRASHEADAEREATAYLVRHGFARSRIAAVIAVQPT